MNKSLLTAILSLLILLSAALPCFAVGAIDAFSDVSQKDWFSESVRYVCEKQWMNGMSETEFSPNTPITRGMMVTLLYRFADSPTVSQTASFPDVLPSTYYSQPVAWAVREGITTGYDTGRFEPNENITREQFAVMVYRYIESLDVNALQSQTDRRSLNAYSDASRISGYAINAMAWAIETELIGGMTQTTLAPHGVTTRAQAATIFMRLDQWRMSQKETYRDNLPAESSQASSSESVAPPSTAPIVPPVAPPYPSESFAPAPSQPTAPETNNPSSTPNSPSVNTERPTFAVSPKRAKAGEKDISVTISIANNPGILGMTLSVVYDESALTLVDSENGFALSTLTFQKPKKHKSGCNFVWYGADLGKEGAMDGTILSLRFDVKDNAAKGTYPITISYNKNDMIDENLTTISVEIQNAEITIE